MNETDEQNKLTRQMEKPDWRDRWTRQMKEIVNLTNRWTVDPLTWSDTSFRQREAFSSPITTCPGLPDNKEEKNSQWRYKQRSKMDVDSLLLLIPQSCLPFPLKYCTLLHDTVTLMKHCSVIGQRLWESGAFCPISERGERRSRRSPTDLFTSLPQLSSFQLQS